MSREVRGVLATVEAAVGGKVDLLVAAAVSQASSVVSTATGELGGGVNGTGVTPLLWAIVANEVAAVGRAAAGRRGLESES